MRDLVYNAESELLENDLSDSSSNSGNSDSSSSSSSSKASSDKWNGRIVHDKPKLTSKQALSQGVQAANHATDSLAALMQAEKPDPDEDGGQKMYNDMSRARPWPCRQVPVSNPCCGVSTRSGK